MIIKPIPTGEPISTALLTGIATVVGTLFGLFRGGISRNVKDALEGLRRGIADVADRVTRGICYLARAVGAVLAALHKLWITVIRPILDTIDRIAYRLAKLIDRVLRPYLEWMIRVRQIILEIYERYFRPVILVIEKMRQALLLFRLLGFKWAQKLDEKLARLEAKLAGIIQELLRRTTVLGGWVNYLLTLEGLLRRSVLLTSLGEYRADWVNAWWSCQIREPDPDKLAKLQAARRKITPAEAVSMLGEYLQAGSGPLARATEAAVAKLREELSRG